MLFFINFTGTGAQLKKKPGNARLSHFTQLTTPGLVSTTGIV